MKPPSLILGADADQQVEFFSATIHVNYAARNAEKVDKSSVMSLQIAVISEGQGLKPQLVGLPNDVLVFGLNRQVIGINIPSRTEVFRHSFDSLFHAFLYSPQERILIVKNDIGLLALTDSGSELWRFEKDVVTDCEISF